MSVQQAQGAIFLLQLCSNILQRRSAQPRPQEKLQTAASLSPQDTPDAITRTGMDGYPDCTKDTCISVALANMSVMLRAASASLCRLCDAEASHKSDRELSLANGSNNCHQDAVFWVLTLLCEVLKHMRRRAPKGHPPSDMHDGLLPTQLRAVTPELVETIMTIPMEKLSDDTDAILAWLQVVQASEHNSCCRVRDRLCCNMIISKMEDSVRANTTSC